MPPVSNRVTSIERDVTNKNVAGKAQNPMWRCICNDGTKFNAFVSENPDRNTFSLFDAAGYGLDLMAMQVGERLDWLKHPISVTIQPTLDGKWWELLSVAMRPADAVADVEFSPAPETLLILRQEAILAAQAFLGEEHTIFDTETTGVNPSRAEITQFAAVRVDVATGEIIDKGGVMLCPRDLDAADQAAAVTGLTRDKLIDQPRFLEVSDHIFSTLDYCHWGAYNVDYDLTVLQWEFARNAKEFPVCTFPLDVMKVYSHFTGVWDAGKQKLKWFKLGEACEREGIDLGEDAHDALADATATAKRRTRRKSARRRLTASDACFFFVR